MVFLYNIEVLELYISESMEMITNGQMKDAKTIRLLQFSLMSFILGVLKDNNAQFIIAAHSPILMGIPGASLYEILETEVR